MARLVDQGRVILRANPSALTGYDDTKPDLLNSQNGNYQFMSDSSGLLQVTDYATLTTATTTQAGNVKGYYQDSKLQQGELGSPILQDGAQYIAHNENNLPSPTSTVYPVANTTVYRNTDGTGAETTSYTYTWFTSGGPRTNQIQSQTTTLPVISAAQTDTIAWILHRMRRLRIQERGVR